MKIITFFILAALSHNALASGCMSTHLKGTVPGWNKPALVSSVGTALAAYSLRDEPNLTDKQDRIASESYAAPVLYFYLALVSTCPTASLEEYKRKKKENEKNGPKSAWLYPDVPTKAQLEDQIEKWRKMSKIAIATVGGINLYSLSRIHDVAEKQSTKNVAIASALLTIATTIYDYDNVFSDEPPPWADFDIVSTEVGGSILPSVRYSYNF